MQTSKNAVNAITYKAFEHMLQVIYKKVGVSGYIQKLEQPIPEAGNDDMITIDNKNILNCLESLDQLRRTAAATNSRDFAGKVTAIMQDLRGIFPDALKESKNRLIQTDHVYRTGSGVALWKRGTHRVQQAEAVMQALMTMRQIDALSEDNAKLTKDTADAIEAMKVRPLSTSDDTIDFYTII